MSAVQTVRALVQQRLTAAAAETFGLFERTIAEYEEELCRSQEENERHRKLLDAVSGPQLRLHTADVQQLLAVKEEVPPEQQRKHIKEEQQDFWSSQEGEQLQDHDLTKCPSTSVPRSSQLRALVQQRLTLAAAETFGLFERTIAEYEEQLCRSQEEKERHRKLLDAVFNPQLRLHRADVQLLSVVKEEVPLEQQEWSSGLDQEDPEPPHIKEEQEELWTSMEGKQLQGPEEADIKIEFTSLLVKREEDDDEEKPQSSQMETEADGEDCGGPEPVRNPDPVRHPEPGPDEDPGESSEPETDDSDDWKKTKEHQSRLTSLENAEVPVIDHRCHASEKPFSCSECGKIFDTEKSLKRHVRTHTGEKPVSCSVCHKGFTRSDSLKAHMRLHTGEKPFSCPVCNKEFLWNSNLKKHMHIHTGEKPFICSVCNKIFTLGERLKRHMRTHTGEKPFSCSVCEKSFAQRGHLKSHVEMHTREKSFTCALCNHGFTQTAQLKRHMRTHAGAKPTNQISYAQSGNPTTHSRCHTDVQQLSVVTEEVSTEQQEWSSSLDQEDPEPPHIEGEQEEPWTSQEGEQLQGLEADTKITFSPFPVKSEEEDEEEETQSSQLHLRQTEQMETEADGEDCGEPEPVRNSDPVRHPGPGPDEDPGDSSEPETDDSDDWKNTKEHQSRLSSLENDEVSVSEQRCHAGEKPFGCSECGKRFDTGTLLKRHVRTHTGEKPFSCSVCTKRFTRRESLKTHMRIHTREKPFSCSVCKKEIMWSGDLKNHMKTHTGEKPFSCSVCNKRFSRSGNLKTHMSIHTREKPVGCSVREKSFIEG